MTKKELVDYVADKFSLPKSTTEKIIFVIMDRIHEGTAKDGVSRIGKHLFKRVVRKARTCRNPRTGETVNVPEKTFVSYRKPVLMA